MNNLNVININHEEGKLTDSNEAIFCWSYLDYRLEGAPIKLKTFKRNVKLKFLFTLFCNSFDNLHKVGESIVKFYF